MRIVPKNPIIAPFRRVVATVNLSPGWEYLECGHSSRAKNTPSKRRRCYQCATVLLWELEEAERATGAQEATR